MRRFGLSDLIVGLVVVGVLMTVGVMWGHHAYRGSRLRACGSNLSQLTKAMYNYGPYRCEPDDAFYLGTGGDWWLYLHSAREVDDPNLFWCPAGEPGRAGGTNYRGPSINPNLVAFDGFFGCDAPDNHRRDEPLNAVLKSGDVFRIERGGAGFARAMRETAP